METIKYKFGKPVKEERLFDPPYELGDGKELQALKEDKAYIFAFWRFTELRGNITELRASIISTTTICLTYEDKTRITKQKNRDEAKRAKTL